MITVRLAASLRNVKLDIRAQANVGSRKTIIPVGREKGKDRTGEGKKKKLYVASQVVG